MIKTKQRSEVLEALKTGDALSAQELHDRLRTAGSRTGLATVYRALRLLADEGEVDVIREDPSQARYRVCTVEHHHHLLCESCGKVSEIKGCEIEDWATKAARRQGFVVKSHRAEILGTCRDCAG